MSKKRKTIAIVVIVVVGVLIGSILAWNLWETQEKEEEIRPILPIPVAMAIDSENNVHIAFQFGHYIPSDNGYSGYYIKLNENGVAQIEKGFLLSTVELSWTTPTAIAVDKMDYIHIFFGNNYFKLDNNGTVLLSEILPVQVPRHLSLRTDGIGNVHVLTDSYEGRAYYLKLNTRGSIEIQKEITNATGLLSLEVDSSNSVHLFWTGKMVMGGSNVSVIYYTKLNESGTTMIEKVVEVGGTETVIDNHGNIHVSAEGCYGKLDNNGEVLVSWKKILINDSVSSFVIDSKGQLHVVSMGMLYTKLDNNGNVLAGPMNISIERCTYIHYPTISVYSSNAIYIAFFGVENGKEGIYFMKLDSEGNLIVPEMKIYELN